MAEKSKLNTYISIACPLCNADNCSPFHTSMKPSRDYHICSYCDLVFVDKRFHLCSKEERSIYDLHENNPNDKHYRSFLNKLAKPLSEKLLPQSLGLDFGCGPGPTLSLMLEELGHQVAIYDKFYADDPETLTRQYDFITSTEVIEHLDAPNNTLTLLFSLLNERGVIGVMTKLRPSKEEFGSWHYKNDPTHIAFYSDKTMRYIAERFAKNIIIIEPDVIIFY